MNVKECLLHTALIPTIFLGKLLNILINCVIAHFSFLKIFEKMLVISLYWFAAQQHNSSLRRQKDSLFDSKFIVESNEYVPTFFKEQ